MFKITSIASIIILSLCLFSAPSVALPADNVLVTLDSLDPAVTSVLGSEDNLYVKVRYESSIPLRFPAICMHYGLPLDVGACQNPAALHAPDYGRA